MEYIKLGATGLSVSRIGLGTWAMGGGEAWGGETDDKKALETIDYAVEHGINLIDTAYVYGKGHSEELVGQAIAKYRDKVVLATKLQRWIMPDRAGVRAEFDATLKRLKTDYVDMYLIHWPMEDKVPAETTLDAIMELKQEGKIRSVGLSNFYAPLLKRLIPNYQIDTLQVPYNLLWRFLELDGTQKLCVDNGISIMSYSSLQQGLLTGKYHKGDTFGPNDMRSKNILFQGERFVRCLDAIEGMKEITAKHTCSMANLALAWVMAQPGVQMSLVGAMNYQEVAANLQALQVQLDEGDLKQLDRLSHQAVGDMKPTEVMWQ